MLGLRLQISGSAALDSDEALLARAHEFVAALVGQVTEQGGGLVLSLVGEPAAENGLPAIFDWTGLETIAGFDDPAPGWPFETETARWVAVGSQRGLEKIPETRRGVWTKIKGRSDFRLDLSNPGWRMAGVIREGQLMSGDVLLAIGGGAGVEHLADLYLDDGKAVVPIRSGLGALNRDGSGGADQLHARALADPQRFARLRSGAGDPAARLAGLQLTPDGDPVRLASEVGALLADLRPRIAFYVRLLDPGHDSFPAVEEFFREVVDPTVADLGFTRYEMGLDEITRTFMNLEIFESLHRAGMVIVDLTGVRPNCMMELGYALGRRRRLVISAQDGTPLPFDADKLPTFFWSPGLGTDLQLEAYRSWFDRYRGELPPLVDQE